MKWIVGTLIYFAVLALLLGVNYAIHSNDREDDYEDYEGWR